VTGYLIGELRAAIASDIADVVDDDVTVYPRQPSHIATPAWYVGWPNEVRYNQTMRYGIEVVWPITYVCSRADEDQAQDELDGVRSPDHPVIAHLQRTSPPADRTAWRSLAFESSGEPFPLSDGDATLLAVELVCRITAAPSAGAAG
jgi:hypothetical protein